MERSAPRTMCIDPENLMRIFLAGISYRDHSKTVADNGLFPALWPPDPQLVPMAKTRQKSDFKNSWNWLVKIMPATV